MDITQPLKRHNCCWHKAAQSSLDLKTFISYRGGCKRSSGGFVEPKQQLSVRIKRSIEFQRQNVFWSALIDFSKVVKCSRFTNGGVCSIKDVKISYEICCGLTGFSLMCCYSTWKEWSDFHSASHTSTVDLHKHRQPYSNMSSLIWLPVLQQLHDVR